MTVPIRVESGLLAEWRQPSPETAVYRIYDVNDELLYIGITNDLYVRWTDHKSTKTWWRKEAYRYDVRWYPSREEAAAEERRAIISERPKHNRLCLLPSQRPVRSGQPGVYSVKQIAQRFRRSPQTIRDLATRPDFPRSVNGRSTSDRGGPRYSIEEIEAYFTANPKQQGKRTDLAEKPQGEPVPITNDKLAELTVPALLATIKELKELRAPLIEALALVYRSMKDCAGDEWAEEWLGEVWTQIPLDVRALAGDEDAAAELKGAQDG